MASVLARLIDLREGEAGPALSAFGTLFALIGAHTILETARDALFLGKLPASRLTLVYALVAGLSLLTVTYNARFVRRFGQRLSLLATLMVAAFGTALFRFGPMTDASVFALYVWSALLGTVLVVQFWMAAGQLFTVAQGKRLLGPIAAGGVLGAASGAGVAALSLLFFPVSSLLLVAAALFMVTALLVTTLADGPERAPSPPAAGTAPSGQLAMLRESSYLKRIAGLVALSTAAALVTDYLFKSTAAASMPAAALGSFFARYYAALNSLALLVQLFLAARIVRRVGVVAALMVMPALLLTGGLGTLVLGAALPVVLATKAADGTFRHSLNRVASELVVMPLSAEVRARAKPLFDTVLSRVVQATAAGAILLLTMLGLGTPPVLAGLLVALTAGWIAVAASLGRPYIDLFRQALRKGTVESIEGVDELDLTSAEAVLEALSSRDALTVVAAMELLEAKNRTRLIPGLILYHDSEEVLFRALEILARSGRSDFLPLAQRLLSHASESVRIEALRVLGDRMDQDALLRALSDPSPAVQAHAAFGLAQAEGGDPLANPHVAGVLARDGEPGRRARIALLDAIRDHGGARWSDALLAIAASDDLAIVEHAALAMAVVKDPRSVPLLIGKLCSRTGRGAVRDAIVALGDPAFDALEAALADPSTPLRLRLHLPRTIARFGTQRAADVLLAWLPRELSGPVRFKILRGLGALVAHSNVKVALAPIELEIRKNLVEHLRLVAVWLPVDKGQRDDPTRARGSGGLVLGLLEDKIVQALERTFRLLQIAHRHEDVRSVYFAVKDGDRRARANALELIDALSLGVKAGPAAEARALLRIVADDLPPAERVARSRAYLPHAPAGYDEALSVLVRDRDDALAALAVHHAMELGSAGVRAEVAAVVRERPGLRELYGVSLGAGVEVLA